MADISQELQAIMQAIYGENVRGSIHDAIKKINDVGEVVLTIGTAVTSVDSSTEGYYEDSLYININTYDLWQCTGTAWALKGNLEGATIASVTKIDTQGLVDTYQINLTNGQIGGTFTVTNGRDGTGSSLASLTDVDISSPVNRQILRYNGTTQEWENSDAGDLTGYNRMMSEADYRALEAISDPVQGTGVYDPDVYFFIPNVNAEGWVITADLTATANSTTSLVFNSTTIGATDAASIHPTSLILIEAEDVTTKTQPSTPGAHNMVKPIPARIDYQDEGECQIVFDKVANDTDFRLWIRND